MSSLLQFSGTIDARGVGLQFVHVTPHPRELFADLASSGTPTELVSCATCGREHARIHVAYRRPCGMFGCWVLFRYLGGTHAPDLSVPIHVFQLPRGARPLSDSENAAVWHEGGY